MFEQFYLNAAGEKVYFHEEHSMRFEWMKAEDINFIKKSNVAKHPIEIMKEINDTRVIGFSINKSSDFISKSKTNLIVNIDDILIVTSTCTNFIRQGYNGRIYYDNSNIPYYAHEHIKNINIKYGYNKFSYLRVNCLNSKKPSRTIVDVVCNDCGGIKKPTMTDLACKKIGCHNCTKKTLEEFIQNSIIRHGELYDYSSYNYINNQTASIIICKKHGGFPQTPNSHLSGSGCPSCSVKGFKTSEPGRFYIHNDYVRVADKAGITNRDINSRISPQNLSYKKIYNIDTFWSNEISIFFHLNNGGVLARDLEYVVHQIAICGKPHKNIGYYENGDGCSETFNNIHRPNVNEAIRKFLSEHKGKYIVERDINGILGDVIL